MSRERWPASCPDPKTGASERKSEAERSETEVYRKRARESESPEVEFGNALAFFSIISNAAVD